MGESGLAEEDKGLAVGGGTSCLREHMGRIGRGQGGGTAMVQIARGQGGGSAIRSLRNGTTNGRVSEEGKGLWLSLRRGRSVPWPWEPYSRGQWETVRYCPPSRTLASGQWIPIMVHQRRALKTHSTGDSFSIFVTLTPADTMRETSLFVSLCQHSSPNIPPPRLHHPLFHMVPSPNLTCRVPTVVFLPTHGKSNSTV